MRVLDAIYIMVLIYECVRARVFEFCFWGSEYVPCQNYQHPDAGNWDKSSEFWPEYDGENVAESPIYTES